MLIAMFEMHSRRTEYNGEPGKCRMYQLSTGAGCYPSRSAESRPSPQYLNTATRAHYATEAPHDRARTSRPICQKNGKGYIKLFCLKLHSFLYMIPRSRTASRLFLL